MILLEDKAYPIPDLIEGKVLKGLLIDFRVEFAVLMHEIETNVFGIFDEGLLLLDEKVGVLSHAFVDILRAGVGVFSNSSFTYKTGILEMLVGFFEVEELALEIKGCHLYISTTYV